MSRKGHCVLFLAGCLSIAFAQSGSQKSSITSKDCGAAATQLEMNQCAAAEEKNSEAELNRVYEQLLSRASDPLYRKKVEAAQKAWIAYRDAELEAKYPADDKRGHYGSIYPMCFANDRTDLTRQRIQELNALLHSSDDSCGGEWVSEK